MILIILALAWIAFLAPVVVRKVRDMGSDRSIDHFHAEHEVLSRQGYAVEPAYRLDEYVEEPPAARPVRRVAPAETSAARPRLTVVKDGDTYRSLESRQSWQEWSQDYDYERGESSRPATSNRYANAYAAVPREMPTAQHHEPIRPVRSMRRRRRVMITRLALATVVATAAALVSSISLVFDIAVLTWLADVAYVALALFALSQGYLAETSVGLGRRERGLAPVEPLYRDSEDDGRGHGVGYEDFDDDGEHTGGSGWAHASSARYALG